MSPEFIRNSANYSDIPLAWTFLIPGTWYSILRLPACEVNHSGSHSYLFSIRCVIILHSSLVTGKFVPRAQWRIEVVPLAVGIRLAAG
jgi:hypothetical protein